MLNSDRVSGPPSMTDKKWRRREERSEEHLQEFVRRAKAGDKRAFGRIFRECYEDIYDYIIRRVGNRSDAEDLTMQVFASGLKAITNYEDRGISIKAWLYKIAHNAVVDHLRNQKHEVGIDEMVTGIADDTDVAEEMLFREDLRSISLLISTLPTAQAEVLILRFLKDFSVKETALFLNKKEVTVRALQFKGIKNLREKLQGRARESGEPFKEKLGIKESNGTSRPP